MMEKKGNRPRFAYLAALALLLMLAVFCRPVSAAETIKVKADYDQKAARDMLAMINSFRQNTGTELGEQAWYWDENNTTKVPVGTLGNLSYDYGLEAVAMQRAAEIAILFSHTRPSGNDCFSAYYERGYYLQGLGENIAANFSGDPYGAFLQWREDEKPWSGQGHRRNMLGRNYTSIGIGHAECNGMHYWVQEFGMGSTGAAAQPDGERWVEVDISGCNVTYSSVEAEEESITLGEGKTIQAPKVSATVLDPSGWAYGGATTETLPAWNSGAAGIAYAEGGTLHGAGGGKTALSASVFGTSVSVPVTVICQNHSWDGGTILKAPDCTHIGSRRKTCTRCGSETTEVLPAKGHTKAAAVKEHVVAATCAKEGSYDEVISCTVCKEELSRTKRTVAKLTTHTPGTAVKENEVAATCAKEGSYEDVVYCRVCHKELSRSGKSVAKLTVHTWDAGKITREPTAEAVGERLFTCAVCGATKTETVSNEKEKIEKAEADDRNSVSNREKYITSRKSDKDLPQATFAPLKLRASGVGKSSVTLRWSKVKGADGYIIYGNLCGKNYTLKKVTELAKTKYTVKKIGSAKLKKGKYYKFAVAAYRMKDGYQQTMAISSTIHACTSGGKYTNPKKIRVAKKSVTLKKGKSYKLKAGVEKAAKKATLKKHVGLRFTSAKPAVAIVSAKGTVKARRKGKTTIWIYAQNGISTAVTVKVK